MTSVHILGPELSRKMLGGNQPKEDEKVADKDILLVGNTLTEKFTVVQRIDKFLWIR